MASADAASSVCLGMEAMRSRCHCLKLLELAVFCVKAESLKMFWKNLIIVTH